MPGIHTPFTYIGKKNTTFGWHKEDGGVGSLNYLHRGKKNMNYFCSFCLEIKYWQNIFPARSLQLTSKRKRTK